MHPIARVELPSNKMYFPLQLIRLNLSFQSIAHRAITDKYNVMLGQLRKYGRCKINQSIDSLLLVQSTDKR